MRLITHKNSGVLEISAPFDSDKKRHMLEEFYSHERLGFFDSSAPEYLPTFLAAGILDKVYSIEGRKFSPILTNNIGLFKPEIRKAFSDLNPAFRNFLKVNTYTTVLARMGKMEHLLPTQGNGQFTIVTFLDGSEPEFTIEWERYTANYGTSFIFSSAYFFEIRNRINNTANLMFQFADCQ